MLPLILGALGAAGLVASVPSILKQGLEIGEDFGYDPTGRKQREADLLGLDMRSAMNDEMDSRDALIDEELLHEALTPFARSGAKVRDLGGLEDMFEARALNEQVLNEKVRLGSISQTMAAPTFESMAMGLGY